MTPALIAPVVLGLLFGLGIGCIPFVNEHLDWRMFKIIPIGGLLIGAAAGFLQFHLAKVLQVCVAGKIGLLLALVAGIGYCGTDIGKYYTMTIDIPPEEGAKPIPMKLSTLVPFSKYMEIRLGASSIPMGRMGRNSVDVGSGMAKMFYLADIAGTGFGAWAVLLMLAGSSPYCGGCWRYKRKGKSLSVAVPDGAEDAKKVLDGLTAALQKNDYIEVAQFLKQAHGAQGPGASSRKIECTEHCCEGCKEGTLIGDLQAKNAKGEWSRVDDTAFNLTSPKDAGFLL